MITIHPAQDRYSADLGWLKCNFSFSFADYNDPDNMSFGPLRVFNDDFIAPGKGFGTHPHRDMEIVTFVLQGELEHRDNTGGSEVLRPGEIQRMTAGSGILHSEMNPSADTVANTLQIWFQPERRGLAPSYEQKAFDIEATRNHLLPVVSNSKQGDGIVHIHQDLTIYLSTPEAGQTLQFSQDPGRKIYIFVIDGDLELEGGYKLARRDAARITDTAILELRTAGGAFAMVMDLPA